MNILHAWSDYLVSGDTLRRVHLALRTWELEYAHGWRSIPLKPIEQTRDSSTIADSRPMPFVKDVIGNALLQNPADTDIIAFTNADVCFCPGLTGWILDVVPRHGAAFFFTVAWWKAHRDEYPDMILGREQCDEVLRQLVKRHGGIEIPGAIYHEKHPSFWDRPENHGPNPGNRHNRRLAKKWFLRTGYRPNDAEWWKI
jgi:hypothetical protein